MPITHHNEWSRHSKLCSAVCDPCMCTHCNGRIQIPKHLTALVHMPQPDTLLAELNALIAKAWEALDQAERDVYSKKVRDHKHSPS